MTTAPNFIRDLHELYQESRKIMKTVTLERGAAYKKINQKLKTMAKTGRFDRSCIDDVWGLEWTNQKTGAKVTLERVDDIYSAFTTAENSSVVRFETRLAIKELTNLVYDHLGGGYNNPDTKPEYPVEYPVSEGWDRPTVNIAASWAVKITKSESGWTAYPDWTSYDMATRTK